MVGDGALLSGRKADGRAPGSPSWNAGGDGPAWTRRRQPYQRPDPEATRSLLRPDLPHHPYAELHCHSNFSFLDGVSHPEQLVEEAAALGLEALAITDHDGLYGVVRFAEAAREHQLPTVFGAELTLTPGPLRRALAEADTLRQVPRRPSRRQAQAGSGEQPKRSGGQSPPSENGEHLLVIAEKQGGYAALARAISLGRLAGEKGSPQFGLEDLAATGAGSRRSPAGRLQRPGDPVRRQRVGCRRTLSDLAAKLGCSEPTVQRALYLPDPRAQNQHRPTRRPDNTDAAAQR
ncbi:MAG: PHP domain-containing protein [Nocardioidaceae bacterium]